MKIELKFAELDQPLFFKGKNFGQKLHANAQTGIALVYLPNLGQVLITYEGETSIIPFQRTINITPINSAEAFMQSSGVLKESVPTMQRQQSGKMNKFETNPLAKAQVGSPMHSDESLR